MKILAVGIGQCGCNIADEFYGINNYAKSIFNRRIEILTDAFAINTDETDLGGVRYIPKDKHHRIIMGAMRTFGHGVGKINLDGARIMQEMHPSIIDNIIQSKKYHESDAIVVIASGGGGTGSGAIGWMVKGLKERTQKPIIAIIVLPFGYEERGDTSYAIANTATCLKMVNKYAHAVFLFDNDRFGRGDISLSTNIRSMNQEIVMNFYDLFCAGEEKKRQFVGTKVIDAGDIGQSLQGISTLGRGQINLSAFYSLRKDHFRESAKQSISIAAALDQALNRLSLNVDMQDVRRSLILVCAPKDIISLTALQEISSVFQKKSPESVVRIGDYPRRGKDISVSVILSKLTKADRLEKIFTKAEGIFNRQEETELLTAQKIERMYEMSRNLPDLESLSTSPVSTAGLFDIRSNGHSRDIAA
ncbi:MAG: hypothetical protein V1767_07685 [Chloroflexota bacterium]